MEIKILQVFYGKDGLPYKDKDRQVHFPIAGTGFLGASNTTKIKFYYDELDNLDETTWVAVSKLPNGKVGSRVLESYLDEELNEHYALLELDNYYTQYKGDVFISLQGYQGGVNVDYDEENSQYEIHGTPTIAATGSIKFTINYANQFVGSGETDNINFQRILADLGTKLGIRADTLFVSQLPTTGESNIFYVIRNDPTNPNKVNIYIWNEITKHYVWVGDNTLVLSDYYTKEQGQNFEESINEQVVEIENKVDALSSGAPRGVYSTVSALETADPNHNYIYLVTADGHWYYWNSANQEWTDGGQYLSTGDAVPETREIAGLTLENDITEDELINQIGDYALYETSNKFVRNKTIAPMLNNLVKPLCKNVIFDNDFTSFSITGFYDITPGNKARFNSNTSGDFGVLVIQGTNIKPYYDYMGLKMYYSAVGIIFADKDDNVLESSASYDTISGSGNVTFTQKLIKTPSGTAKVYISIITDSSRGQMLYGYSGAEKNKIQPNECEFFETNNKNLLNMKKVEQGYYYSNIGKKVQTSSSNQYWLLSPKTELPYGTKHLVLSLNGNASSFAYVSFYDDSGIPFSYSNPYPSNSIDVPDGARYITFTMVYDDPLDPTNLPKYQLESGFVITPYQEYKRPIEFIKKQYLASKDSKPLCLNTIYNSDYSIFNMSGLYSIDGSNKATFVANAQQEFGFIIIQGNDLKPYYDFLGYKRYFSLIGFIVTDADDNVIFSADDFDATATIDANTSLIHKIIEIPSNAAKLYISVRNTSSQIGQMLKEFSGFDNKIKPEECSFFERKTKNLLDMSKCITGKYYSGFNRTSSSSSWLLTPLCELPDGATHLRLSNNGVSIPIAFTQFYDENKVPIYYANYYYSSSGGIDIPTGAKYVSTSLEISSSEYDPTADYKYQLEVGTQITGYDEYTDQQIIKPEYLDDGGFSLVKGKKWVAIGDSITEHNFRAAKNYVDFVSEILGLTPVNLGVSGTGYRRSSPYYNRIASIPADTDIITFYGSGNDAGDSSVLGTPEDEWDDSLGTSNTLCAYVKHTFDLLIAAYPLKKFGVITPIPWDWANPANPENWMKKYSDNLVAICKLYGVPCLNLYELSGLRPWNSANNEYYFKEDTGHGDQADGTHPNSKGHEFVSHIIADFINRM